MKTITLILSFLMIIPFANANYNLDNFDFENLSDKNTWKHYFEMVVDWDISKNDISKINKTIKEITFNPYENLSEDEVNQEFSKELNLSLKDFKNLLK